MTDVEIIVFDLDDTLYLERDFAHSGFRATADWIEANTGIAHFAETCAEIFAAGDRARIFDRALEQVGLAHRTDLIAQLVDLYRFHQPSIALAPDAGRYLKRPRKQRRAIITDGLAVTQMAKIRALGLEDLVDLVICTDDWGKAFWKPHDRAFEAVETWSGADPRRIVYIADNPAKDFVTPRRRGWRTVGIARPERVHVTKPPSPFHEPDGTIASFDEL